VAEINLQALRHNYRVLRSRLPPSAAVFAVVKADAYGHGAVPVARALAEEGARMFGVATVEEGIELREAGLPVPIVVLGGVDEPQAEEAHAHGLSATLFDEKQIPYLARAAAGRGKPFPVHVKVDTGMGRIGILPEEQGTILAAVKSRKELRLEGWMTHLSSADGGNPADREFTLRQLDVFAGGVEAMRRTFGPGIAVSALNSAGILSYPEHAYDLGRPGIALYGSLPAEGLGKELSLRPVMRLVTKVASLKELPGDHPVSYGRTYSRPARRRIAVVPLGYADGYRRSFSNSAEMLVMGRRVPVAGRVCMDHTMLDVTGIPGVAPGTDVTVMGGGAPAADDLARTAGTIPYEILTQIGRRVPRRVVV
jgi:alanine racemase